MNKKNYLVQLSDLIAIIDININCCELILSYIKQYSNDPMIKTRFLNDDIGGYLLVCQYNHFAEAVSTLKSLILPVDKNEIAFQNLSKEILFDKEFIKLKEEFKKKGFVRIRHNIIDHKNNKNLLNPFIIYTIPLNEIVFLELKNYFNKLNNWAFEKFDLISISNSIGYSKALGDILQQIDPLIFKS